MGLTETNRRVATSNSLPYLMENIERFFNPGYVPNEEVSCTVVSLLISKR